MFKLVGEESSKADVVHQLSRLLADTNFSTDPVCYIVYDHAVCTLDLTEYSGSRDIV